LNSAGIARAGSLDTRFIVDGMPAI
jgi:hypothetical protein